MRAFGVLRNPDKDPKGIYTKKITDYLRKKDRICYVTDNGDDLPSDAECVLVLGGDGTLLRAAKKVVDRQLPLLGINLGTLGYLAEVNKESVCPALDLLMRNDFQVEKRMMLSGTVVHKGVRMVTDIALNDIVITRLGSPRVTRFMNYVNGEFLNTYQADGIIISTPTGSTGYSLSAGGPIVSPEANLIILTPLAPHTINTRSVIFPKDDTIKVEIGPGRTSHPEAAMVNYDGSGNHVIQSGDYVMVRRSRKSTNIIKISNVSFLEVLRKKMNEN